MLFRVLCNGIYIFIFILSHDIGLFLYMMVNKIDFCRYLFYRWYDKGGASVLEHEVELKILVFFNQNFFENIPSYH